jgi:hypothetical protein
MNEIIIDKYRDSWVLASIVEVAEGSGYLDAPPVRVIPYNDKGTLKSVIQELLEEEASVVPRSVLYEEQDPLGIRPRAVGAKSAKQYLKETRAFKLQRTKNVLSIEEWEREGWGWHAKPLWRKNFGLDEMDKLIDYLIKKTKPKSEKGKQVEKQEKTGQIIETIDSASENYPVSFGYKMGWFAIRSTDIREVVKTLKLTDLRDVSLAEGIDVIYREPSDECVFVTPPIKGWTLVVGFWAMGNGDTNGVRAIEKYITKLSSVFEEVQAFATHRIVEYHHWMLARKGGLIRSFAYLGERGEILSNVGDITSAEKSFKWHLLEKFTWLPSEEDVMKVAGQWSLNPTTNLNDPGNDSMDMGLLAKTPRKSNKFSPSV